MVPAPIGHGLHENRAATFKSYASRLQRRGADSKEVVAVDAHSMHTVAGGPTGGGVWNEWSGVLGMPDER